MPPAERGAGPDGDVEQRSIGASDESTLAASPWLTSRSDRPSAPDRRQAAYDFLLVRAAAGGGLVDLTNADVGFWETLLGLDYILHR